MKARSFLIGFSADSSNSKNSGLVWKALILGIVFLIVPIAIFAQAAPCSCKDKADLINQLNKASAASNTIQFLQQSMGDHNTRRISEVQGGENPENVTYKEMIDRDVADDVYMVDDPKAGTILIKTDGSSCDPTVSATSACLKSLAEKMAPAHKSFCETKKVGIGSGYLTVRGYLSFLRDLYIAEIAEILNRLKALEKSCASKYWIGTIRYSFVRSNINKNEKPGVVETIEDTLTIDGIIRLNGDYALEYPSSWEGGGKYDENKESKGSRPCKGGLATAKLDGQYQTNHVFKWDKNGETSQNTEVGIGDVEGNKVPIDFRVPKIVLKTSGYSKDSYVSNCPKPNGDFDGPSTPWDVEFPLDSQKINFIGSYFPGNPEKISGSSTLESGKTGTVIVTYNLYKSKP